MVNSCRFSQLKNVKYSKINRIPFIHYNFEGSTFPFFFRSVKINDGNPEQLEVGNKLFFRRLSVSLSRPKRCNRGHNTVFFLPTISNLTGKVDVSSRFFAPLKHTLDQIRIELKKI